MLFVIFVVKFIFGSAPTLRAVAKPQPFVPWCLCGEIPFDRNRDLRLAPGVGDGPLRVRRTIVLRPDCKARATNKVAPAFFASKPYAVGYSRIIFLVVLWPSAFSLSRYIPFGRLDA